MAAPVFFRGQRSRYPATPRLATSPQLKPLRAALLYECADLMGLRHTDKKHTLRAECQPTVKGVAVHSVLYLCEKQRRYDGQCDLMLQSPAQNGHKELLTGLRAVPVPNDAAHLISAAWVSDYRPNDSVKRRGVPAAVVLQGKLGEQQPGWLLVLVTGAVYQRYEPSINEATATAAVRAALPMLPQWLESITPVNV